MDNMKHRRLQELDGSDFEIVKGEPDIRGWDVKNAGGQKIGEVEDLVIDAQQKKVRYMVVDLDKNELKLDSRKVLIPIGLAELHKDKDDVLLPSVGVTHLSGLPAYDKNNLDEETEKQICTTLGRKTFTVEKKNTATEQTASGSTENNTDFYQHDYFHDDNLYKNRLHEARPAQTKEESEFDHGLKLWELRSEGGVVGDSGKNHEVTEEQRMERVHSRRKLYEDRRESSGNQDFRDNEGQRYRKDNSIEGRIRDEGLQDG